MDQSNTRPRPIKGWDEHDVYTRWRHAYVGNPSPGYTKQVKRWTHKRERREWQAEIEAELTAEEAAQEFNMDHAVGILFGEVAPR